MICSDGFRLPLLAKGWDYHGAVDLKSKDSLYSPESTFDLTLLGAPHEPWWSVQPVLILRKPEDATETLEEMQDRDSQISRAKQLICDKRQKVCGRRGVLKQPSLLLPAHDPTHALFNKPRAEPILIDETLRVYG